MTARGLLGSIAAVSVLAAASPALAVPPRPIPEGPGAAALPAFSGRPAVPHPVGVPDPPRHPFMAPAGRSNLHVDGYQTDVHQGPGPLGRRIEKRCRARSVAGSRLICRQPVFEKGASATDQSLIGTGRSLVAENNYGYSGPAATQGGKTTSPGLERVDLDPGGGCHSVWRSPERAPSVVPKLSAANGLVYTYTKDPQPQSPSADAWYLTALDFVSGRTGRLRAGRRHAVAPRAGARAGRRDAAGAARRLLPQPQVGGAGPAAAVPEGRADRGWPGETAGADPAAGRAAGGADAAGLCRSAPLKLRIDGKPGGGAAFAGGVRS